MTQDPGIQREDQEARASGSGKAVRRFQEGSFRSALAIAFHKESRESWACSYGRGGTCSLAVEPCCTHYIAGWWGTRIGAEVSCIVEGERMDIAHLGKKRVPCGAHSERAARLPCRLLEEETKR